MEVFLAEMLERIEPKLVEYIQVGAYKICRTSRFTWWIEREGGEGMEVRETTMIELFNIFWGEHF